MGRMSEHAVSMIAELTDEVAQAVDRAGDGVEAVGDIPGRKDRMCRDDIFDK